MQASRQVFVAFAHTAIVGGSTICDMHTAGPLPLPLPEPEPEPEPEPVVLPLVPPGEVAHATTRLAISARCPNRCMTASCLADVAKGKFRAVHDWRRHADIRRARDGRRAATITSVITPLRDPMLDSQFP